MKLAQSSPNQFDKITGPDSIPQGAAGIENVINVVIGFLTVVGGILFLIWLIVGTYTWITAEGKPDKLEKARNHITQAITGLIILVGAYAITALISTVLGLSFLDFAKTINNLTTNATP